MLQLLGIPVGIGPEHIPVTVELQPLTDPRVEVINDHVPKILVLEGKFIHQREHGVGDSYNVEGVVTGIPLQYLYYLMRGGVYLSPWANSLRIVLVEPLGKYQSNIIELLQCEVLVLVGIL